MLRWVASYPKSGNTWVRLFMLAYESAAEFELNKRRLPYMQDIEQTTHEAVAPCKLADLSRAEVYALHGAALVKMMRSVEGPMLLKTHAANIMVNKSALIPPALTDSAVYVVRDPRDVALSMADHFGCTIDQAITKMGNEAQTIIKAKDSDDEVRPELVHFISSWSLNVESWTRNPGFKVHVVRYEDLHRDPLLHFRELAEFMFGHTPDPVKIEAAVTATTFERLRALEAAHGFNAKSKFQERFFRSGRASAWRDELTPEQVGRIERDHGVVMAKMDYPTGIVARAAA